mgnify:CR=1 FL=1
MNKVELPSKLAPLFRPSRYKILHGGRGSGKSVGVARALLIQAAQQPHRVLCAREFQVSIRDSVHKLLSEEIEAMGLSGFYDIQQTVIRGMNGSEFIFKGLRHNITEVKGMQGITRCWVEEAQAVSDESWEILGPTIRGDGSEIWVTMNPYLETDPTYRRFVASSRPDAVVIRLNWSDNPWFPAELEAERRHLLGIDPQAYAHVWDGACLQLSEAAVFGRRVSVEAFDTPEDVDRFFFGADWGFSQDPTALIRCFIRDDCLYIDHEAFGIGVEIDHLAEKVFDKVPGSRDWPIKADSARPETISYMRRQGFAIDAAEKWPGSVEDGVEHLKGFRRIIVHPRCRRIAEEFRLYSYAVDKQTGDILPKLVDRFNHGIDAVRYSLDQYIMRRGGMGVWARLAG